MLCRNLVSLTIFFVVVSGQDWGLLHFNRDHRSLVECIENHDLFKNRFGVFDLRKYIIANVASGYHGKTVPKETIEEVSRYIDFFLSECSVPINNHSVQLWKEFEKKLQKTLQDCSDSVGITSIRSNNIESSILPIYQLPVFIDEPAPGVNLLLDYLLVDTIDQDLFSTNVSRAEVKRYVEDSFSILRRFFLIRGLGT